jgi:hypothetical protein
LNKENEKLKKEFEELEKECVVLKKESDALDELLKKNGNEKKIGGEPKVEPKKKIDDQILKKKPEELKPKPENENKKVENDDDEKLSDLDENPLIPRYILVCIFSFFINRGYNNVIIPPGVRIRSKAAEITKKQNQQLNDDIMETREEYVQKYNELGLLKLLKSELDKIIMQLENEQRECMNLKMNNKLTRNKIQIIDKQNTVISNILDRQDYQSAAAMIENGLEIEKGNRELNLKLKEKKIIYEDELKVLRDQRVTLNSEVEEMNLMKYGEYNLFKK